jgi:hypothetical protein
MKMFHGNAVPWLLAISLLIVLAEIFVLSMWHH